MSSLFLPHRRFGAFTLIELLTVIAIIGILAAIIIPTVGKVRQTARNAQCVSILREWGRSIQLYANDNKGKYQHSWASASSSPYMAYFTNSGRQFRRYRVCPMMPEQSMISGDVTYAIVRGSVRGTPSVESGDFVHLARARNPSQYLLMSDAVYKNGGYTNAGAVLTQANSGNNSAENLLGPLFDGSASEESSRRHGRVVRTVSSATEA